MSTPDPETAALMAVMQQLEPLEPEARLRILKYAAERYALALPTGPAQIVPFRASIAQSSGPTIPRPTARSSYDQETEQGYTNGSGAVDVNVLTNALKDPEIYQAIEEKVYRQKNLLNRILIALYAYERAGYDADGLTSGDIAKFFGQLKIKVHQPDISNALSDRARQFVYPTGQRKRGGKGVRYRLNPIGLTEVSNLLTGAQ